MILDSPPTVYSLFYKEEPSFATFELTKYIDIPLLGHLKGQYSQTELRKKLNQCFNVIFPFVSNITEGSQNKMFIAKTLFSTLVYCVFAVDIPLHRELISITDENTNLRDMSISKTVSNEAYEYWRQWCLNKYASQNDVINIIAKSIPHVSSSQRITNEELSKFSMIVSEETNTNFSSNMMITQLMNDLSDFIGGVISDESNPNVWVIPIEDANTKYQWFIAKFTAEKFHERSMADVLLTTLFHVDHYKTIPKRNLSTEPVSLTSQYEVYESIIQSKGTINAKKHSYTFVNTWDTLDFISRVFSWLAARKHVPISSFLTKTAVSIVSSSIESLTLLQYLNSKSLGFLLDLAATLDRSRLGNAAKQNVIHTAIQGLLCIDKNQYGSNLTIDRYRSQRRISCIVASWVISEVFFEDFELETKYVDNVKEMYGAGIWCLPFDGSTTLMDVFLETESKIQTLTPLQLGALLAKEYNFNVQKTPPRMLGIQLQNTNEDDQTFRTELSTLYSLLWKLGQIVISMRDMVITSISDIMNINASHIPVSFVDIITTVYAVNNRAISFWSIAQKIKQLMKIVSVINRRTINIVLPLLRTHKKNITSISIFDRMYNILTYSQYYNEDETSQQYADTVRRIKQAANVWKEKTNSQLESEWGLLYGAVAFLPLIFDEIIQSIVKYAEDISTHIKTNMRMNTSLLGKKLLQNVEDLEENAKKLAVMIGKLRVDILGDRAKTYQQTFTVRFRNMLPYMPQLITDNI